MIVDTHAHLYFDSFTEDFEELIKRAVESGVTGFFNVGVDIQTSQKALEQVQTLSVIPAEEPESIKILKQVQDDNNGSRVKPGMTDTKGFVLYSSIGIHPHEYVNYISDKAQVTSNKLEEDIKKLEEIYRTNPEKVRLVGECGLDFAFNRIEEIDGKEGLDVLEIKKKQIQLFQAQIELAKKLNLPLSVHCRDDRSQDPQNTECWDTVIDMTKTHFGIYHCYSGLPETTNYILRTTNFLISFAGNLTYKNNEYLREAVKVIPLERIVVETDCPFLPPQSKRGKRNEPSFILETIKCIAEIKGLTLQEVVKVTSNNSLNIIDPHVGSKFRPSSG